MIFTHAGDDFTDIFAAFHPPSAYDSLAPFYIGELDAASIEAKPLQQRNFERAYRDLRGKLVAAGGIAPNELQAINDAAVVVGAIDQRQSDIIAAIQARLGF